MLLNIIRDKILFVLGRYSYDGSEASSSTELAFARPPKLSAPPLPGSLKPLTPPPLVSTASPELITKKDDPRSLDIVEILATAFYIEARNKDNNLFSLIISNISSIAKKNADSEY